jgi:hypothetical protein
VVKGIEWGLFRRGIGGERWRSGCGDGDEAKIASARKRSVRSSRRLGGRWPVQTPVGRVERVVSAWSGGNVLQRLQWHGRWL